MSKTLNFAQHLWDMGQNLQKLGQAETACRLLERLTSLSDLSPGLFEDAHLRLAEMHLDKNRFKKARRKLAALLTLQPEHAYGHYLMGCACEDDDECAPARALKHYRRSTKLEPENPAYWCALGNFALSLGEREIGVRAIAHAETLAPDDPKTLSQLAMGLRQEGETTAAGRLLQAALFRNSKDKRFHDLWTDHQFQLLHEQQGLSKQAARDVNYPHSMILPFTRPAPAKKSSGGKRIRHDLPSSVPGPKMPHSPSQNFPVKRQRQ